MLLEAKGLIKIYGRRRVLDGVEIRIGPGEVVGLLGRNGAGKSTSFKIIMGIVRPNAGRVYLDGADVTRLPVYRRARRGMGYLAQDPSVFQRMTVRENLLAILEFVDPDGERRQKRAGDLLQEYGLTKVADQRAHTLSGGEQRRLEIARAMVRDPKIMLLDEPFSGVDPIAVGEIQQVVRGLKKRGIGVLLTDHNVRETLVITDRSYIIDEGRVLASGAPKEIVTNPAVRQKYLGDSFRM